MYMIKCLLINFFSSIVYQASESEWVEASEEEDDDEDEEDEDDSEDGESSGEQTDDDEEMEVLPYSCLHFNKILILVAPLLFLILVTYNHGISAVICGNLVNWKLYGTNGVGSSLLNFFNFDFLSDYIYSFVKDVNDDEKSRQIGDAVALIKGEGKNLRRKEKRARIEQIRASLGLSDSMRTPAVNAVLYNLI